MGVQLFTRRQAVVPLEPDPSLEELYLAATDALHASERELTAAGVQLAHYNAKHKDLRLSIIPDGVAIMVGALDSDPVRSELESVYEHCRQQLHQALREHSDLKVRLGLCR